VNLQCLDGSRGHAVAFALELLGQYDVQCETGQHIQCTCYLYSTPKEYSPDRNKR
jgi:hypothetical protein